MNVVEYVSGMRRKVLKSRCLNSGRDADPAVNAKPNNAVSAHTVKHNEQGRSKILHSPIIAAPS